MSLSPKTKESKISKDIDKSKLVKVYTFESNSAGGILCVLIYAKAQFVIKKLDVEEQKLVTPVRTGFVAVEWGGSEI